MRRAFFKKELTRTDDFLLKYVIIYIKFTENEESIVMIFIAMSPASPKTLRFPPK
jgi:hypothetical protein